MCTLFRHLLDKSTTYTDIRKAHNRWVMRFARNRLDIVFRDEVDVILLNQFIVVEAIG